MNEQTNERVSERMKKYTEIKLKYRVGNNTYKYPIQLTTTTTLPQFKSIVEKKEKEKLYENKIDRYLERPVLKKVSKLAVRQTFKQFKLFINLNHIRIINVSVWLFHLLIIISILIILSAYLYCEHYLSDKPHKPQQKWKTQLTA